MCSSDLKYPKSIVDLLLSSNNHFVLQNDTNIRKRWIYTKGIFSTLALIWEIRKEKYDFVIDLMDNPSTTSTFFCLFIGGRWNLGLEKENDFVYDVVCPLLSRQDVHIVERIAQLLIPFGIEAKREQLRSRYSVGSKWNEWIEQYLDTNKLRNKFRVGINISAGTDVRFWGIDNFVELLERLSLKHPEFIFVILHKPTDNSRAQEIADKLGRNCIVSPLTESFDQFAAMVSRMSFLITPDTSAVHLASAFNIPSVVMYVQSNKALRIWEPFLSPHKTLISDVDDLKTISAESACTAVQELLKEINN